jgi:hypothetical protein
LELLGTWEGEQDQSTHNGQSPPAVIKPSLAVRNRDAAVDSERPPTPSGAARGYASLGKRLCQ